jgi:trypsin
MGEKPKSSEARRLLTVVIAVGMLTALLVYVDAQGSLAESTVGKAALPDRTPRAAAAEAAITRTNVATELEVALGESFGGVWFEPATAQLHVGVTSAASREAAEAVAAGAGLADTVVETPVASTWDQLQAAQDRWDTRLVSLLEGGEASTSVAPDNNAVEVALATPVAASRRAALRHAAAAESVKVKILSTPYRHIGVEAQARCNKFAVGEAFCDPTLVAGVTFDGTKDEEGNRETCTAGPTVLPRERTKPAEATKTYVLTAGHCIVDGGGVGKKWFAYDKKGEKEGEKEVGPAIAALNAETDVGVVEVTSGNWATAKSFIPVVPTIAPWDQEEPEPFAVIAQRNPVKNTKSCLSGQKTGISCGEIVTIDQTIEVEEVVTKNLVEVKGAEQAKGDSGGPWFAEPQFKEKVPTGYVEGTHVGEKGATENPVFEPLSVSLPELKKLKGLDLELLTKSNEKRHPFKFRAEAAPTVLTGKQHLGATVLPFDAGFVSCAETTYTGEMTEAETIEVSLTPNYAGCEFAGLKATVDVNGCQYKLTPFAKEGVNFEGSVDVVCPEGKKIEVTGSGCTITIGPQLERRTVTFTNVGAGATREITVDFNLAGLTYEEHKVEPAPKCATNTVPTVNGMYNGGISPATTAAYAAGPWSSRSTARRGPASPASPAASRRRWVSPTSTRARCTAASRSPDWTGAPTSTTARRWAPSPPRCGSSWTESGSSSTSAT